MLQPIKIIVEDANLSEVLYYIFQNAFGNPIMFDATPTNATMRANTWGLSGNDLFIKFPNGTTKKVTMTVVP
jgi:hypothetical protein